MDTDRLLDQIVEAINAWNDPHGQVRAEDYPNEAAQAIISPFEDLNEALKAGAPLPTPWRR